MKTPHPDTETHSQREARLKREAADTETPSQREARLKRESNEAENLRERREAIDPDEKRPKGESLSSIHGEVLALQKALQKEAASLPEVCWKHLRHIENLTSGNSVRLRSAIAAELREFRFQLADAKIPKSQPHLTRLDSLISPETPKARQDRLDAEALNYPDETAAQRKEREAKAEKIVRLHDDEDDRQAEAV